MPPLQDIARNAIEYIFLRKVVDFRLVCKNGIVFHCLQDNKVKGLPQTLYFCYIPSL